MEFTENEKKYLIFCLGWFSGGMVIHAIHKKKTKALLEWLHTSTSAWDSVLEKAADPEVDWPEFADNLIVQARYLGTVALIHNGPEADEPRQE